MLWLAKSAEMYGGGHAVIGKVCWSVQLDLAVIG